MINSRLARQHTIHRIRFLRAIAPHGLKPLRRKLPKQHHPDHIALDYFKAIRPVCVRAHAALIRVMPQVLRILTDERARAADEAARSTKDRVDAAPPSGPKAKAIALVDDVAKEMADSMRPNELHAIAQRFGQQASNFQRDQLGAQVRAAVSVPLSAIEQPVQDHVDTWATQNVNLIKTIPSRYFARVKADVHEVFESGMHVDSFTAAIRSRYDMSENDARRIARDQIGKLTGQVNRARQEGMGVERFEWCTMNDERVRDSHAELEGQIFRWDDPPEDEDTGEPITPGSAIQCRCYAAPVLDDIIDDLEGDEGEGEGGDDEGSGEEGEESEGDEDQDFDEDV